ncbi:unnamed protein product [Camellia sinensis]
MTPTSLHSRLFPCSSEAYVSEGGDTAVVSSSDEDPVPRRVVRVVAPPSAESKKYATVSFSSTDEVSGWSGKRLSWRRVAAEIVVVVISPDCWVSSRRRLRNLGFRVLDRVLREGLRVRVGFVSIIELCWRGEVLRKRKSEAFCGEDLTLWKAGFLDDGEVELLYRHVGERDWRRMMIVHVI